MIVSYPSAAGRTVLLAQVTGYALGITGTLPSMCRRSRLLGAAGSFLVLNAAAWLAFWLWLSGRAEPWPSQQEMREPLAQHRGS